MKRRGSSNGDLRGLLCGFSRCRAATSPDDLLATPSGWLLPQRQRQQLERGLRRNALIETRARYVAGPLRRLLRVAYWAPRASPLNSLGYTLGPVSSRVPHAQRVGSAASVGIYSTVLVTSMGQ